MSKHHLSSISINDVDEGRLTYIDADTIFPKPLPYLVVGPIVDELGFTLTEKAALQLAFRQITPLRRRFGKDIFYTYLTNNERSIEKFRFTNNHKIDLTALHGHALAIMHFIRSIVNEGLEDVATFGIMFNDNVTIHEAHHIITEDIIVLMSCLKDYLLDIMANRCSESLVKGFEKIENKFISYREGYAHIQFTEGRSELALTRSRSQLKIKT